MTAEYGTIEQYRISCSAQNRTGNDHVRTAHGNITYFIVTALQSDTTYNCCINAENIAGSGVAICGEGTTFEDSKRNVMYIYGS